MMPSNPRYRKKPFSSYVSTVLNIVVQSYCVVISFLCGEWHGPVKKLFEALEIILGHLAKSVHQNPEDFGAT